MTEFNFRGLACPLDDSPLAARDGQLVCTQGHSFDIARQGYVNLLPVQHKRSRHPGDSQVMVAARTDFLDSGVYAPVAERLAGLALQLLPDSGDACVLDAGCGEGYYLDRLYRAAQQRGVSPRLVGMDISKPAIIAATRRNRPITWLVASNARPPLLPGTVDLVLSVFGFPSYQGFAKVLRPGGVVLLVDPGPDHLIELRRVIYPEVRRSAPPGLAVAESQGFVLQDSQVLGFRTAALHKEQLAQLLLMTPHLHRASQEGRAAAERLQQLSLTVDLVFRTLVLS